MRIVIFGDSIARGSYDEESAGWTSRLSTVFNQKSVLEDGYFVLYNLAISGETAAELVGRIDRELPLRLIDKEGEEVVIFIASGINDSRYYVDEDRFDTYLGDFKQIYKDIINIAKQHTEHVFCLGLTRVDEQKTNPAPPPNRRAFRNKDIEDYETVIKGDARELDVQYIDVSDCVSVDDLSPDGIHPNSTGHRRIYERVKETLEAEGLL